MRRRRAQGDRSLSAEELVSEYNRLTAQHEPPGHRGPSHPAVHAGLAALGYDDVDVFRARLWLRRGQPENYVWDQTPKRHPRPLPETPDSHELPDDGTDLTDEA